MDTNVTSLNMDATPGDGAIGVDEANVFREQLADLVNNKFNIALLKPLLKAFNLSATGRKAQMQERILALANLRLGEGRFRQVQHVYCTAKAIYEGEELDFYTGGPQSDRPAESMTYTQRANMINASPRRYVGHEGDHVSNYSSQRTFAPQHHHNTNTRARASSHLHSTGNIYGNGAAHTQRRPLKAVDVFGQQSVTPLGLSTSPGVLSFAPSPFYTLISLLAKPVVVSNPYPRDRIRHSFTFSVAPSDLEQVLSGACRVYLLSQDYARPVEKRPVYFPFNYELSVNNLPIQANTRGVKGQPGSAQPVDITKRVTDHARINSHRVEMTIHVSQDPSKDENTRGRAFAFAVYIVKIPSLEDLVKDIDARPHNSRESVMEQIRAGNDADDLMAMEATHSLRDPVALVRLRLPVRSTRCSHIDCFDCHVYLQLQLQASTWKCPICSKLISFDSLTVDDYFQDVLAKTAENVDSINVAADGTWTVKSTSDDLSEGDEDSEDDRAPKRARSEPQIEIIDLSSDTEDEDIRRPAPVGSSSGHMPLATESGRYQARNDVAAPRPHVSVVPWNYNRESPYDGQGLALLSARRGFEAEGVLPHGLHLPGSRSEPNNIQGVADSSHGGIDVSLSNFLREPLATQGPGHSILWPNENVHSRDEQARDGSIDQESGHNANFEYLSRYLANGGPVPVVPLQSADTVGTNRVGREQTAQQSPELDRSQGTPPRGYFDGRGNSEIHEPVIRVESANGTLSDHVNETMVYSSSFSGSKPIIDLTEDD